MAVRYDKEGSVVVPVTAAAAGVSLAATCDPALTKLLAAFKAIANTKLAAALKAAAGGILTTSNAVEDTFPHEPTRAVCQRAWTGPALFMWREKERLFHRTQVFDDAECTGKLLYVLPPLTEEDIVKIQPIRVAMRTCLQLAAKYKGDPTYSSGVNILSDAGLESFEFTAATYSHLPAETGVDMYHTALEMDWTMREREAWVLTQYTTLTDIDTTITSNDDTTGTTTVVTGWAP